MALTKKEQTTIDSYNAGAVTWARSHSDANFWKEELELFHKYLPKGKILEIGCGGGRDARELVSMGYNYTGTDASKKFVEVARKNNPDKKFLTKSVYDLNFPNNTFDGFWASAVLSHIPKSRINEALANINRVVRKGGIGFIAIKKGYGEKMLEEISSDGKKYKRFWSFFTKEEFETILHRNGINILKFIYKPISERTKWLIFFVKVVK